MSQIFLYGVTLLLIILNVKSISAQHHFRRGRFSNGALGEPSRGPVLTSKLPKDEWFEQSLDHFVPTNNQTWKQRFYTNMEFYVAGGPVFLMISGGGEASANGMVQGAWTHYAKEHNAMLFQLEHRFYGKSHPTEDLSTENLEYLSSEQAIADLAFFISAMNTKHNLSTKWIAFGGSYSGSLAAWLRQKYPHLIHGAVSSSAPLLAKSDFREYLQVVVDSLRTYSDDCVDAVAKSIGQVEILLRSKFGQHHLNEKFSLCDPVEQSIENTLDISNLFKNLASIIAGVVQYNKDYSPYAEFNINQVCDIMVNQTIGQPVYRLAHLNSLIMKQKKQKCFGYKYDNMIIGLKKVSWDSGVAFAARQWTYQTCTEFGFYQTSDATFVFGDRLDVNFFIRICTDVYGPSFNAALLNNGISRTNTYYGELHAETTNVIYVHGSIDPWHPLGLTKQNNPSMPTIYIEGTAHCADMNEPLEQDLPQLKDARVKISKFISSLL